MLKPLPSLPQKEKPIDWKEEHAKILARFQDLHRWLAKNGIQVDIKE